MEIINFIIMFFQIFYLIPIFKCPIFIKERIFVGSNECVFLLKNNSHEFFNFKRKNDFNLLSFVLSILGISKIDSKSFFFISKSIYMVIFFFMALLLRLLWSKKDYKELVDSKREYKKQNRILNASKYILRFYLSKYWEYMKYLKTKEIFMRRNKNIDKKIKKWEKSMKTRSKFNYFVHDEEKEPLQDKNFFRNLKIEKTKYFAEKIINDLSNEEPILDINTVERILGNGAALDELEIKLKEKQKEKLLEVFNHVINLKKLNLSFLKNKEKRHFLGLNNDDGELDVEKLLKEHLFSLEEKYKKKIKKENLETENNNKINLYSKINKINIFIKNLLLKTFKKYDKYDNEKNEILNSNSNLLKIIKKIIYKHSVILIYISFLLNILSNGNLVSIIPIIFIFLYGITNNPFPSKNFYNFLFIYMFFIIFLKMIYQIPLFCTTSPYTFSFSDFCEFSTVDNFFLYSRIDYLIGIRKFYGESSFPKNGGMFLGLIYDYFIIISLVIHRTILKKNGIWDFVRINNNPIFFPKIFKKGLEEIFIEQNIDLISSQSEEESSETEESDISSNIQSSISELNDLKFSFVTKNTNEKKIKNLDNKKNLFFNFLKCQSVPKYVQVNKKNNPFETLLFEPLFMRRGKKLYKMLFLTELIIFFFLIFFYDVLIGSSGSFKHALEKSQFSEDMVLVILKLLSVILLNRVCYCKRYTVIDHKIMTYKENKKDLIDINEINEKYQKQSFFSKYNLAIRFILHTIIVIYIHYFIFKEVPLKNKKLFFTIPTAKIVYTVFFIYLIISCYQLKHGFAIDEHFQNPYKSEISSSDNIQRKIFHSIPFLFEIKIVLDWTITETALDLFQWFKLEDAYITLKLVKYQMKVRRALPFPINFKHKFFFGFCFLIFLLGIIILPILIFSTLNPSYIVNEPLGVKTNIKLWTYEDNTIKNFPIFSSEDIAIKDIKDEEYKTNLEHLFKMVNHDKLSQFKKLEINTYSENIWNISPPKKQKLQNYLSSEDVTIFITATWSVDHELKKDKKTSFGSNTLILNKNQITKLQNIIKTPNSIETLDLENLFPKLIYMDSTKYLLFNDKHNHKVETISNINLSFKKTEGVTYWELRGEEYKKLYFYIHCDYILGSIIGKTMKNMSVIGFYVTIVLAIGQIIKSLFHNIMMRVIYEEMPNCNQLIEFCDSIYMARKEKDLVKEKHLYELLVKIYRSPELLIQLTDAD